MEKDAGSKYLVDQKCNLKVHMYLITIDVADVPAVLLTHGTYSFLRFPHGFLLMLGINQSMVAVSLNKILICKLFK